MPGQRQPRERDPIATRADILAAARTLLARDGPEGLSVVQVANLAGVNRGTAYQHFPDRAALLHATIASVGEALIEAVWSTGETSPSAESPASSEITDRSLPLSSGRLAQFTVENANFCRVWLLDLLSSDDPGSDPLSQVWFKRVKAFCASDDAVPGIDAEAYAAFTLTAYLSWPVWMRAEKLKPAAQRRSAQRLVEEILRMAMFGVMKPDRFPNVRKLVAHDEPAAPRVRRAKGGATAATPKAGRASLSGDS